MKRMTIAAYRSMFWHGIIKRASLWRPRIQNKIDLPQSAQSSQRFHLTRVLGRLSSWVNIARLATRFFLCELCALCG